jgi:hypothetical protein
MRNNLLKSIGLAGLLVLSGCGARNYMEGIVEKKSYDSMSKSLVLTVKGTNNQSYYVGVEEDTSIPINTLNEFISQGDRISFPIKLGFTEFNEQGLGKVYSSQIRKINYDLEDKKAK